MKLNRDLQRAILKTLADAYPGLTREAWDEIQKLTNDDILIGNMLYLEDHGLIQSGLNQGSSGNFVMNTGGLKITTRGLDFLEDDGGLSAILGVVTVKFHDDTLKALIEAKIQQSDLPPPDKKRWLDQLRELPAETTKHLVLKLVDKGLEHAPAALPLIGSALGMSL